MALLADEPKLTEENSISNIMDTEIAVLENMAVLINKDIAPNLLTIVEGDRKPGIPDIETLVIAFKKIMCGFAMKEESIACIINAITKLLAVKRGISPCDLECCLRECKCDCKKM